MSDIDFWGALPGDVCNRDGDIRWVDTNDEALIISRGLIEVTSEQAERAETYGWTIASIAVAGRVAIKR